jgi:hypothetical protein
VEEITRTCSLEEGYAREIKKQRVGYTLSNIILRAKGVESKRCTLYTIGELDGLV